MPVSLPNTEHAPSCVLWLTEFRSPLPAAWVELQRRSLSASEVQRLSRIKRPLRREQFLVGHTLARRLLKSLGIRNPAIDVSTDGRPIAAAACAARLHVGIAHSQHVVAALVSTQAVGVDIEVDRVLRDPAGTLKFLGVEDEAVAAGSTLRRTPSEVALRHWVVSEARIKARSAAAPSVSSATWLAEWNSCWIAVAGTANSPAAFACEVLRGTYNPILLNWTAHP